MFEPAELRLTDALRRACEAALQRLVNETSGVTAAVVVTSDGCEVASVLPSEASAPKLAAMTSSIHALGEAVVAEALLRRCQNVVIEAETGNVVMLAIPESQGTLLLTVIASKRAILGHLLWSCRTCTTSISYWLKP